MSELISTKGTKQIESNLYLTLKSDGLYVHKRKALWHRANGKNYYGGLYVTRLNSESVTNTANINKALWDMYNTAPTPINFRG